MNTQSTMGPDALRFAGMGDDYALLAQYLAPRSQNDGAFMRRFSIIVEDGRCFVQLPNYIDREHRIEVIEDFPVVLECIGQIDVMRHDVRKEPR